MIRDNLNSDDLNESGLSTGLDLKHTPPPPQPLGQLADYHFSTQRIPGKIASLKKYFLMSLGALGGLGYWGVVDKYNEKYNFSDFIAISNNVGVAFASGFFLLQSVDLANELLNDLSGSVPPALANLLEIASPEERQSIKRKAWLASSVSGFPFLIISLANTLPPIDDISSDFGRKIGIGVWAGFFYLVNVGLHLLPFAVLQSPAFSYYRFPLTMIETLVSGCGRLVRTRDALYESLDKQVAAIQTELKGHHDDIRGLIARRAENSLTQSIQAIADSISLRCRYNIADTEEILLKRAGVGRLIFLMKKYPPQNSASKGLSPTLTYLSRVFGAQLQLGAGFVWWTNVFPALFDGFKQAGLETRLTYALTGLLGALPSYALIVILAFFGEMQLPRLVNYIMNCGKKLIGMSDTDSLLHPAAKLNPLLFGLNFLAITFISYFSPINAKAVNEEQYGEIFSDDAMQVLAIYATVGTSILTFIALQDLYFRYKTEISAVFGTPGSHQQLFSRLLLAKDSLPKDILRSQPKILIDELKELNEDSLDVLLGKGKGRSWVLEQEEKTQNLESQLSQKKSEKSEHQELQLQGGAPASTGFFSRSLFSCFSCCRRKRGEQSQPLLQAVL